jgi:hypothetical protein
MADLRHRNTESCADGAAVLVPVWKAGRRPPGPLPGALQRVAGCSAAHLATFGEWLRRCQRSCEYGRAFECEKGGWVGAFGKLCVEGIEPVAAEHPIDTFGCDAAGEVGLGCDNGVHSEVCELGCLFVGQGGAEWSDPDVTPSTGQGDRDGIHRALYEHRPR